MTAEDMLPTIYETRLPSNEATRVLMNALKQEFRGILGGTEEDWSVAAQGILATCYRTSAHELVWDPQSKLVESSPHPPSLDVESPGTIVSGGEHANQESSGDSRGRS